MNGRRSGLRTMAPPRKLSPGVQIDVLKGRRDWLMKEQRRIRTAVANHQKLLRDHTLELKVIDQILEELKKE